MSGLENSLFQLKLTAKQLKSQSAKSAKQQKLETAQVGKAIKAGNNDIARIHAENAIRKGQEQLNLLRLSARIDAVASRVQTAVTMRSVTKNMGQVVKGMDRAMQSMNMEQISLVMDKFEQQFEDLDVQAGYMEGAMNGSTATSMPTEEVDALMSKVADEAGLELTQDMAAQKAPSSRVAEAEEDRLHEKLKALRS
jgi:charged multivesicular body protein 1